MGNIVKLSAFVLVIFMILLSTLIIIRYKTIYMQNNAINYQAETSLTNSMLVGESRINDSEYNIKKLVDMFRLIKDVDSDFDKVISFSEKDGYVYIILTQENITNVFKLAK